jgi:hypothetical protein
VTASNRGEEEGGKGERERLSRFKTFVTRAGVDVESPLTVHVFSAV